MVVKITSPHSLERALNYNEKKVQQGKAECIGAVNYLLTPGNMNFYQKMERLQDLISLNERTKKTNTLHISLNFDPSEKFEKERLCSIAETYMEKIGFTNQPYLVYQHHDAGHPHIHILTTTIQPDGKRINTYNIGRNQSEIARKQIEKNFGLVVAQAKKAERVTTVSPANVQRAQYGKSETKRTITNVLDAVINHFRFTSLAELNAILKQYNVVADRGKEDGIIYKANGLLYKLLDEKGNRIGVPIKASLIYSKPTLKNLEKTFEENGLNRQPDKKKLRTAIDWALTKFPANIKELISELQKEKIQTVLRQNKDGLIYGITFIDYRTKSVFNGSDLGKQYSIAGIQQNLGNKSPDVIQPQKSKEAPVISKQAPEQPEKQIEQKTGKEDLLEQLTGADKTFNRLPYELLKKKKKKRKNL